MRLWHVKTIMGQVFKFVAPTSTEALELFHQSFPGEENITSLSDRGHVYTKEFPRLPKKELK